jgi:hypothetical protein
VSVVPAIISYVVPKQERLAWRKDNVFRSCCSFPRLQWYVIFSAVNMK